MSTDLLFTPATKAAALIRDRKLSPVEYLDAVLKAAEKANPKLNCFRVVMADEARRDAKKAEDAVMRGDALGPLHGVPVSIKDLVDVKDVPTRHGSAIFADNPPAVADDILVKRLREAGAVVFAKSSTPEFGVKGLTDGPSFGITRNPWNLERTPGGSSGGAAAAVAAGLGPIGLGTDGAGSVRGPASCSGLVGLKPTLGVVPYDTTRDAFGNNIYAGPLSRTITDAAVFHAAISGPSEKDPWALSSAGQRPLSPKLSGEDLSGVRIGYIELCANPRIAQTSAPTRAPASLPGRRWAPPSRKSPRRSTGSNTKAACSTRRALPSPARSISRSGRTRWTPSRWPSCSAATHSPWPTSATPSSRALSCSAGSRYCSSATTSS